jgi:photosystem II stability/assembly factor-like uncharacterized protein
MSRSLIALLLLLLTACATPRRIERVEKERSDDPDDAAAYSAMRREGSDDPQRDLSLARAAMRRMDRYSTVTNVVRPAAFRDVATNADGDDERPFGKWFFLGPGNVGGRTRVILIDPADPRIMYAAGVSGGVWKSRSGGELWEPVGDDLINIAVNTMALHPTDHQILYAGTGEGYFRESERGTALPLRGNGIFVSRDGAESWTQLPATAGNENFHFVNDLAISSHDPNRVYAATRTGVWRSTDGGTSWTNVVPTTVKGGCLDLAFRGDTNGDLLFASCGTFDQATVYRTLNGESDAPWQPVLSEPNMGRTTLAVAPSQPATMYALSASNEPGVKTYQGMLAIWRSDRNGEPGSWTAQVTNESTEDILGPLLLTNLITADNDICGGPDEPPLTMGWYCNTIAVDPADPERLWVGGVDLFRSDDGGRSWGQASYWWTEFVDEMPFAHADQHVIAFHPQYNGTTNKIAYFGNDGGVFRTTDARAAVVQGKDAVCIDAISSVPFTAMNNNYGVTQFYHGAVFPTGRSFLGGTQDNGTILGTMTDGPNNWRRVYGGDGGYVGIDVEPRLVYAESQYGNLRRSTDGGRNFLGFIGGLDDEFLFIAPLAADPNLSQVVWLGGTQMWRNTTGQRWERASTPLGEAGTISALAIAPGNSNRVLAGTHKGTIFRTDSALTATANTPWTPVRPRDGFVSSLVFDPMDVNVVYATYAGFGGAHVWKSIDAGATWAAIGNSLPDMPVHSIAVDPTRRERLYLGTDLGVFVSLDGGATWAVENSGFAAAVTEHVTIAPGALGPAVYAFTHGRGAWRAELTIVGPKRRGVRK